MNGQEDASPDLSGTLEKLLSDPEAVAKAMEMAKKLTETADFSAFKGVEEPEIKEKEPEKNEKPRSVQMEDRIRLLCALKPYLSKKSAERVDTVISLSKLAEIAESLGIRLI